ncbi:MAG: rhodanese-like domain-containing protein [Runella slithyformis]|jgi:rhodanese-related sulfurtransferase|nr:MAG: rhodanese-like domain-containing protein [Runella slithyformis]TAF96462.1 MAG: rhodanese-like domain-containing protein [Runella sp.]TAG18434.1 MAG: rhodanese-like domain-containing protein [Cytophagales bacterium]TAG39729.1 MAG: rhodanese-like domain-containing protein [Cytophagia bacterium]TAF01973.1 MAG: rhodanese-like domain-containing protein [Runella slithyformis]
MNYPQDITLVELPFILQTATLPIVIDVREPWEYEEFNVGGVNIPLADIRARRDELRPFQTLVVVCTNGTRSRVAAKDYCRAETFNDKQIYHLKGGILEMED